MRGEHGLDERSICDLLKSSGGGIDFMVAAVQDGGPKIGQREAPESSLGCPQNPDFDIGEESTGQRIMSNDFARRELKSSTAIERLNRKSYMGVFMSSLGLPEDLLLANTSLSNGLAVREILRCQPRNHRSGQLAPTKS